jgi:transforming growth factor-beta-induced protein
MSKLSLLLAVVVVASCSGETITDLVVATADLSQLETAVVAADLATTLAGTGPFTVFAPNNAAFGAIGETAAALIKDANAGNKDPLKNILLYHVVPGKLVAAELKNDMQLTTASGLKLTVKIAGGVVTVGGMKVLTTDIMASNGVVHVVASVANPPTITDLVVATPALSSLKAAVVAAGLAATLAGPGPYTVFAPTDDAFAKIADTAAALIKDAEAGKKDPLANILLYHVIPGKMVAADLKDGMQLTTASGLQLAVKIAGGVVTVGPMTVTGTDIMASNGVVHTVNTVAIPPAVPVVTPAPTSAAPALAASSVFGLVAALALLV